MPMEKNLFVARARCSVFYPDIVKVRYVGLKLCVRPWVGFKGDHLFGAECHPSGILANVGAQIYASHALGSAHGLVES